MQVLGIKHPLALAATPLDLRPPGAYSLRGHSIGGFGSVTTNKLVATLVGELFGKQVQAYPRYGSEKKGLPTTYYLTIADGPIRVHAELDKVDFVPLHDVSAFGLGNPLAGLVDGGDLFIQSPLATAGGDLGVDPGDRASRAARPPDPRLRRSTRPRSLAGTRRAPELEIRMQGVALVGVFLRVAPFAARAGYDRERLLEAVGTQLGRFFGKRGTSVIKANLAVIAEAWDGLIDVTAAIAGAPDGAAGSGVPATLGVPA